MKLTIKTKADKNTNPTLVVFVSKAKDKDKSSKNEKKPNVVVHCNLPQVKSYIHEAVKDGSIHGNANSHVFFRNFKHENYNHLMVVGLGSEAHIDLESIRRAFGSCVKSLEAHKVELAQVAVESISRHQKDMMKLGQALSESALIGAYKFSELKTKKDHDAHLKEIVFVVETAAQEKAFHAGFATGTVVGECVNFGRRLGDMPGNLMTPAILADEAQKAAKGTNLKVTIWDKARIKKEKMGCLYGVGKGSAAEPRFIIMEYKGGPASQKPICFVGKGLTFDAGGISIKPSAGMEEMKFDMSGGGNTIATMLAIAKLKLKVNAIGLVPSSENLLGPEATKPGDIHIARNGKSVEINNTDAEGRLILADALCYATEQKPACILDMATLTGAMVMALGNLHTGVFCKSGKLMKQIKDAAEKSGEWVWQMPLVEEHGQDMHGTYADLSNIGSVKGAGSAQGAAFMENFVGKDIPWAHFDIAGTANDCGGRIPYFNKRGATGVMVRTWLEFAKSF